MLYSYILLLIFSTFISLFLSGYLYKWRSYSLKYFLIMLLLAAEWSASEVLEITSISISSKLLYAKLSYIAISFIPVIWFMFILEYSGKEKLLKSKRIKLIYLIPIITLILALTGYRDLIWKGIVSINVYNKLQLNYIHGVCFFIFLIYSYLLILFGSIILLNSVFDFGGYKQFFYVLLFTLIPWSGNVMYLLNMTAIDVTPVTFSLSLLIISYSIFFNRSFSIQPIIASTIFKKMNEGIIYLDKKNRPIYINPMAYEITGIGRNTFAADFNDLIKSNLNLNLSFNGEEHKELKIVKNSSVKWFDVYSSPLYNFGKFLGHLVLFHDITAMKNIKEKLKENEEKQTFLYENVSDVLWIGDINMRFTFVSPSIKKLLGYTSSEALKMMPEEYILEPYLSEFINKCKNMENSNTGVLSETIELQLKHKNGSLIWVEIRFSTMSDINNKLIGFFGVTRDISEKKKTIELLEKIAANTPFPMIITEFNGDIIHINSEAEKLLEFKNNDILNKLSYCIYTNPKDRDLLIDELIKCKCVINKEISIKTSSGKKLWVIISLNTMEYGERSVLLAAFQDITERKIMEEQLRLMAITDPLTGIFNRMAYMDKSVELYNIAKNNGLDLSVIVMDLDHFKRINDTYGHKAGDKVIKLFVQECKKVLRSKDIFGRIGGEEFAITLLEADLNQAKEISDKIRANIEKSRLKVNDNEITFTVSLGLTTITKKDTSFSKILVRADEALYDSKNSGRNKLSIR